MASALIWRVRSARTAVTVRPRRTMMCSFRWAVTASSVARLVAIKFFIRLFPVSWPATRICLWRLRLISIRPTLTTIDWCWRFSPWTWWALDICYIVKWRPVTLSSSAWVWLPVMLNWVFWRWLLGTLARVWRLKMLRTMAGDWNFVTIIAGLTNNWT